MPTRPGTNPERLVWPRAGGQGELFAEVDFKAAVPIESEQAQPKLPLTIEEFCAEFAITRINQSTVRWKEEQIRFVTRFIEGKGNDINSESTGSGKTVTALLLAAWCISRGGRVLFLTPQEHLVRQTRDRALEKLLMKDDEVGIISGAVAPRGRDHLIGNADVKLIISTPEIIERRLQQGRFPMREFALVIVDEVDLATGRYAYMGILPHVHEAGVRLCGLTANPADNRVRLHDLEQATRVERIEVRGSAERPITLRERRVVLEEDIRQASQHLIELAHERVHRVRIPLDTQGMLFEDVEPWRDRSPAGRIHSSQELERLNGRLEEEIGGKRQKELLSLLAGVHELRELNFLLASVSRYAFLRKGAYGIGLAKLYCQMPEGPPFRVFRKSIYRSEVFLGAYGLIARNTPFEPLLHAASVSDLYARALPGRATAGREKYELFGEFLKSAEVQLVRDPTFSDHAKEREFFAIVRERIRADRVGKDLVYTPRAEHGRFLVQRLNHFMEVLGYDGVFLAGQSKMVRREALRGLRDFAAGDKLCAVSTSVTERGWDVPGIERVVQWAPVTSPRANRQQRGRAGRDAAGSRTSLAECIVLIADGVVDPIVDLIGRKRYQQMLRLARD